MESLFGSEPAKKRVLPPSLRRLIVDLKAEYPALNLNSPRGTARRSSSSSRSTRRSARTGWLKMPGLDRYAARSRSTLQGSLLSYLEGR